MNEVELKIADYFKDKAEVLCVYLFGSHARGKTRRESDLDIAVLLRTDVADSVSRERENYLVELSRIVRKDVHLVTMNTAGEELLKQIYSKGKCLLINNARETAEFRMTHFARIADFGRYRNLMQMGFVKRLMEERKNG